MKKTFTKVALMSMLFMFITTAVSAKYEIIERINNENYGNKITIDTTELMCDTQPTYGNGIYLQVDNMVEGMDIVSTPDKYKKIGFSNSPIYVYDENLTYIKSIEFEGEIISFSFIDGYFYFSQTIYGNNENEQKKYYYKSVDMNDWNELTYDEYFMAKRRVTLYGGMKYTWKPYSYELDGMIYNTKKTIECLIDNDNMYKVEREHADYISGESKKSTDFNVYIMSKRSLENYNDTSLITSYISLDALSMFELPSNADTNDIWNDNEYIYIGIRQEDAYCYRIPISDMSNCIKVKYNDTYLSFAANPIIENGRTLVPLRFIFEQMGAKVDWDDSTQTVVVEKGNDIISFSIDNKIARVNNNSKVMDIPARLIEGKTMIPLRFLSEELGFNVDWEEESHTVIIKE